MPTTIDVSKNEPPASLPNLRSRPLAATVILSGGVLALLLLIGLSVSVGAADIAFSTVWEAVFHYNPDLTPHQIIQELRLPRVLGGAMVGACLAVAGALMQGMTRNPMADPGLLGLNAGAGLAMAVCLAFLPGLSFHILILFSFLGAGLGALLVFGLSAFTRGGLSPIRLILSGAAVSALLIALSEGIALYYNIGQDLAFWFAGWVAGTTWLQLKIMLHWVAVAMLAAISLSRSITVLSLGEEVAAGLGQRTRLVKLATILIVLLLAGSAVAVVGAVGFVGLLIPHLTRYLVGPDYRWIIPCSAVLGSLLIVLADMSARMIQPGHETPLGALIALLGVPFFLYLSRTNRRGLQ